MPSACGKMVNSLGRDGRKTCLRLSTSALNEQASSSPARVKTLFTPQSFHGTITDISPSRSAISPLYEHCFYPLSTAPINTPTK